MTQDERDKRAKVAKAIVSSRNPLIVEIRSDQRTDIQHQIMSKYLNDAKRMVRAKGKTVAMIAVVTE